MTLKWTKEQKKIFKSGLRGENMLVRAYAGCSKTTTMVQLAKRITQQRGRGDGFKPNKLFIAFNVRAQADILKKMGPEYTDWDIRTFNSLGAGTLWSNKDHWNNGKGFKVEQHKMSKLLDQALRKLAGRSDKTSRMLHEALLHGTPGRKYMISFIGFCKNVGIKPDMIQADSFIQFMTLDIENADNDDNKTAISLAIPMAQLAKSLMLASIEQARHEGIVDFDDQIFLSTLYCVIPGRKYDVIIVDEAQDLSPLNRIQIERAMKSGTQLTAVGDEFQSLYAFRGAEPESMTLLKMKHNLSEYKLSMTFRCPPAIVKLASQTVNINDYKSFKPKDGKIRLAFNSMVNSKNYYLWEIGSILRHVKRRVKKGETCALLAGSNLELCLLLADMVTYKKDLSVNCVFDPSFTTKRSDVQQLFQQLLGPSYATELERIIKANKSEDADLTLSTVHRGKGLEWDNVYLFDPERMEDFGMCVRYVAETRAIQNLYYLRPENYNRMYSKNDNSPTISWMVEWENDRPIEYRMDKSQLSDKIKQLTADKKYFGSTFPCITP